MYRIRQLLGQHGGWYEGAKAYGQHDKKWVAISDGAAGATLVGRQSQIMVGFDAFPRTSQVSRCARL
jgi:hypothetical protein